MFSLRESRRGIIKLAIASLIVMFLVDYFINFNYLEKSLIKVLVFLLIPFFYSRKNRYIDYRSFFRIGFVKELLGSLILGLLVYGLIIGTYFFLKDSIDLAKIETILSSKLRVEKANFLYVALYISFFNSLLEEIFFRGFVFLGLKKLGSTLNAYIISSFLFAIYHVAIMANWFSLEIFALSIVGLFLAGLIFNGLNHKNENIYNSWLVHMFANFAINTVGLIMFGII